MRTAASLLGGWGALEGGENTQGDETGVRRVSYVLPSNCKYGCPVEVGKGVDMPFLN